MLTRIITAYDNLFIQTVGKRDWSKMCPEKLFKLLTWDSIEFFLYKLVNLQTAKVSVS